MGRMTFCGYFNRDECRSCSELATAYPEQILAKEARLAEALSPFSPPALEASVISRTEGFRNRAKLVVTGTSENPVVGLAGEEDLDEGRALLECPIHHPKLNELIVSLPKFIRDFNLVPYRISDRMGELKGIILFYSSETDEMYVRFVLRSKECVSRIRKLLPSLQAGFPAVTVVTANLQTVPHAILEGPEEIFISENRTIRHSIGGVPFRLAPQAFVQTNSDVAARLYSTAADWIRENRSERVAELFCGQGAFSFFAAKSARALLGIDWNAEGVAAANQSAREQGLAHLTFKAANSGEVEEEIAAFRPDLVIVNPPRRGLSGAREPILKCAPPRLIYSSCALGSLAQDLKALSAAYRVRRVRLFDMFPHTTHFETLVELEALR